MGEVSASTLPAHHPALIFKRMLGFEEECARERSDEAHCGRAMMPHFADFTGLIIVSRTVLSVLV